jgi:hypothetical protein
MIQAGSSFLTAEVAEGDADDANRMQAILVSLGKLLSSEIGELASGSEAADDLGLTYQGAMSASLDGAIKSLMALQEQTPADYPDLDVLDHDPAAMNALRGLLADMNLNQG